MALVAISNQTRHPQQPASLLHNHNPHRGCPSPSLDNLSMSIDSSAHRFLPNRVPEVDLFETARRFVEHLLPIFEPKNLLAQNQKLGIPRFETPPTDIGDKATAFFVVFHVEETKQDTGSDYSTKMRPAEPHKDRSFTGLSFRNIGLVRTIDTLGVKHTQVDTDQHTQRYLGVNISIQEGGLFVARPVTVSARERERRRG